jgi:hypothetical protein
MQREAETGWGMGALYGDHLGTSLSIALIQKYRRDASIAPLAKGGIFASSPFVPVAIGFFGLGTGYFIWGGQALFGFPKTSPEVNRSLGLWGFWMPGFMQFLTGIYLLTRPDVVQRRQQSGSFIYGGPRVHCLRHSLVRDGSPAIYRFQRPVGWLDGRSIPVSQHSRR